MNVEKFDCTFVIFGEPASKANSRKLVTLGGRPAFIKSQKARDYVTEFQHQCRNQVKVRQVKQRMAYWGLDKDMPRAVIRVVECDINDVPSHLVSTRVQDSVNK